MTAKQARATLDKAIMFITAAENQALATDGAVPATREVMSNDELDQFARLVIQARKELDPRAGQKAARASINRSIVAHRERRGR